MKIKDIYNQIEHRPWKLPTKDWNFYQEWNDAIFLHWQVDQTELQKYVPKELEIDTFNGKSWISLVAFTMEKVRPKLLPSFPPISNFDEINIRTYAKYNNKEGVYFLSIEAGTKTSCQLAKTLSKLPYRYSRMSRDTNSYKSTNLQFKDRFELKYEILDKVIDKNGLDKWLTERYALFHDYEDSIYEFEIHHVEWPLYNIDLLKSKIEYSRFDKLLDNEPDLTHYSPGVQVIAWDKKKNNRRDSILHTKPYRG